MAVISVYDYDFFNYEKVIPNLECAKIISYYRSKHDIALLTPILLPEKYTKCFVRKEYDDGIFPKEIFAQNCEYGGRAFNPLEYQPLTPRIENTIPDMHIYDKYINNFGKSKTEIEQIKRILNCAHIRMAPDSHNLLSFEQLQQNFQNKVTGIFLHDYDLASLKPYDLIIKLQNQRTFLNNDKINPYPVGNKYPINIYSSDELDKWCKIIAIPEAFFLEYYGLMEDKTLYNLCMDNKRMARQIYYNISYGCYTENDFLLNRAEKIFVQILFLRRNNIKILLKYDNEKIKTKELQNFIELLNCWLGFKWQDNFMPRKQTLYNLCKNNSILKYTTWAYRNITLTTEEIRNVFQYIREKNYNLFKLFYEVDYIIYRGGKFIDGWT